FRRQLPDSSYDLHRLSVRHIIPDALPPLVADCVFIDNGILHVRDSAYLVSGPRGVSLFFCDSTGKFIHFSPDVTTLPERFTHRLREPGEKRLFRSAGGETWLLGDSGGLRIQFDPWQLTE